MPNRLFYTVKLSSSLLKEYKYDLSISFEQCLRSGLIISLSDSQMLKSVRSITGQNVDRFQLEAWYTERDYLKKKKNTKENRERIRILQQNIYNMMYIPEYVTVVMESIKDYERMFKKGFILNGRVYKRFSCSASQARVSTIVFVAEDIKEELKRRLDNGRDLNHPLAPSKYNAYFGLYSSSIKEVRKPRFCVVADYCENQNVDVDFVIETDKDSDDIVEPRTMEIEFNRFDGSGMISPQMAELWGQDLGEDYTPCQFCLRSAFTKGMVNEFDFVRWCEEKNDGNYIVTDVYGKQRDLREVDVILSEGQVKLWDSWESQESFEENCEKNGIVWGITKYAPKKDKDVLVTNYQFLQTLNLTDEMIERVCQDTIDYIQGVSYSNKKYALLFMLGDGMDEADIEQWMESSDNYWLKTLILEDNLFNDKYTKEKIRDLIVKKIELACLGKLNVRGNFQCIVPDNYAYMEAITGHPVKGLLGPGEAFSEYWNKLGVTKVDAMRSPLTHFSEHGIDTLRNTEDMRKWYSYSYSGYICNVHDEFTMVHAGSDFDYDIIASTDNPQFVNGKFPNQRVVTYTAKKPKKKLFTEDDLFVTDTFSFGTQIGQITNTCSTICALIPTFPKGSRERKVLEDRLRAGCAAQSRQIDKTKIGENVKTLGTICKQFQRINHEVDTEEQIEEKMFYNRILADKKPYFFRYKYKHLAKEYNEYRKKNDENAQIHFSMSLKELEEKAQKYPESLSVAERNFLMYYEKFLPVINSDCVMNKICKYIEGVDFHIKQKVRSNHDFDYKSLQTPNFSINNKLYFAIKQEVENSLKEWEFRIHSKETAYFKKANSEQNKFDREVEVANLKSRLEGICSNEESLANHLVYLFYEDKPSLGKSTLWAMVGRQIFENVKKSKINETTGMYYVDFPVKDANGDIEYLYEKYQIKHIGLNGRHELCGVDLGVSHDMSIVSGCWSDNDAIVGNDYEVGIEVLA